MLSFASGSIKFVCGAKQHIGKFWSGSHCHEICKLKQISQVTVVSTVNCGLLQLCFVTTAQADKRELALI